MPAPLICPACGSELRSGFARHGIAWACPDCVGRAATLPVLRRALDPRRVYELWRSARRDEARAGDPCPGCRLPMARVAAGGGSAETLDVCCTCTIVWWYPDADTGSADTVDRLALPTGAATAPPEGEEADELERLFRSQLRMGRGRWGLIARTSLLAPELAGGCLVVTVLGMVGRAGISGMEALALDPEARGWHLAMQLPLSPFFHADLLQLAGNAAFFFALVDPAEVRLGSRGTLLFVLVAAAAGNGAHLLLGAQPAAGAAAMLGALATYAALLPAGRRRLAPPLLGTRVGIDARLVLILLVLWQLLLMLAGYSAVSPQVFLGGVLVGALVSLFEAKRYGGRM